jgi:hypothetical protein
MRCQKCSKTVANASVLLAEWVVLIWSGPVEVAERSSTWSPAGRFEVRRLALGNDPDRLSWLKT